MFGTKNPKTGFPGLPAGFARLKGSPPARSPRPRRRTNRSHQEGTRAVPLFSDRQQVFQPRGGKAQPGDARGDPAAADRLALLGERRLLFRNAFGIMPAPVYCTKIASRLTRTYTDKHGLKDLVRDLLGIDIPKQQQLSDWGADELRAAQVAYAAGDVLHLHALRNRLDALLAREGRTELAAACFRFLPDRARLDLAGWAA